MIMHIAVHHARPDQERLLLDHMQRYETSLKGMTGLLGVHVLRDINTDSLVGLSVWASKSAYLAARSYLDHMETNNEWDDHPPVVYYLEEVDFSGFDVGNTP